MDSPTPRREPTLLPDRVRYARRLAGLSQAALAREIGIGPSAVAQWELPSGTSPTMEHLAHLAVRSGVAFEWLATGRGTSQPVPGPDAANAPEHDTAEERLIATFRRLSRRRREALLRWLEDFS
ncbi:MAG TPA: helix-turn-helix transcriptional regulator [Tahibacter sp.]|uniref:helix-turn-helix domain-containing protein n=1 Tax=Tahibacter sp. TaxID=2056211 RepID=UPI002BB03C47|nr:helix-turn-helix transcriptional regulator [Tahibacter sp.]HSX62256.1 helix-turn-helix transcriptional regulator [Tahibacter sp.]